MPHSSASVKSFFDSPAYCGKRFNIATRRHALDQMVGAVDGLSVLDLGCGDGSLSLQWLEQASRLTLVDLSDRMLERARAGIPAAQRRKVALVRSELLEFDPEQVYDLVLCVGVLAHVSDPRAVVERVAALTAAGGRAVIQFTDVETPFGRLHQAWVARFSKHGYAFSRLSCGEVLSMAAEAGLRVLDERRYGLILPGMRRLPDRWLYRWNRFCLDRPSLGRHGSELVLLLSRSGQEGPG